MFDQDVTLGPGTGTFTQHTFEILIMLLGAFLLGLWLGWMLWNRYKQEADKLRLDVQSLTATVNALNAEIGGLKSKFATAESNNMGLRVQVDKLTEENRILRDQMSEASEDLVETEQRNRQLETELGLSFAPGTASPETFPLEINITTPEPSVVEPVVETPPTIVVETPQVEIAIEVPPTAPVAGGETIAIEVSPAPPSAVEETPVDTIAAPVVEETASAPPVVIVPPTGDEKDDLTVVEGIGPKIQELLYQYDIRSYRQLAETDVARLKEILAEAGPQLAMHDPGTWPSQANLAANDQWEALKSIQGFLKGGKKPT